MRLQGPRPEVHSPLAPLPVPLSVITLKFVITFNHTAKGVGRNQKIAPLSLPASLYFISTMYENPEGHDPLLRRPCILQRMRAVG